MNYIDLILIGVVLVFAVFGLFRGFLYTVLHFTGSVIAAVGAKLLSSPVASAVYDKFFSIKITDGLYKIMPSGSVTGELRTVAERALSQLPETVVNAAKTFGIYPADIIKGKGTFTVEYIENDIIAPLVRNITAVVAIVLLFLVFSVFLRIICYYINKALTDKKHHKTANGINKILGAVFGALKGIIPSGILAATAGLAGSYINSPVFTDAVSSSAICGLISDLLLK